MSIMASDDATKVRVLEINNEITTFGIAATEQQEADTGRRLRGAGELPRGGRDQPDHPRGGQQEVHGLRAQAQDQLACLQSQGVQREEKVSASCGKSKIEQLPCFLEFICVPFVVFRYSDFEWLKNELERDSKV